MASAGLQVIDEIPGVYADAETLFLSNNSVTDLRPLAQVSTLRWVDCCDT